MIPRLTKTAAAQFIFFQTWTLCVCVSALKNYTRSNSQVDLDMRTKTRMERLAIRKENTLHLEQSCEFWSHAQMRSMRQRHIIWAPHFPTWCINKRGSNRSNYHVRQHDDTHCLLDDFQEIHIDLNLVLLFFLPRRPNVSFAHTHHLRSKTIIQRA